jgi:GNAT superfamily N-acetyltransferase
MQVRAATRADSEAIERIRIRGWQAAYRHVFPPEELDRLPVDWSRIERSFDESPPGRATFVAERDGIVIGWALVGPDRDGGADGELYGIYVDPDAWSTGAGRALIERAEQELAGGYAEAILWVLAGNERARRFYERAGWRLDGAGRTYERLGVEAPLLRYRKTFSTTTSRS